MKLIALALFALLVFAPGADAAPLPWKSFSDVAHTGQVVGHREMTCSGGQDVAVIAVAYPSTGEGYIFAYAMTEHRLLVWYFPQAQDGAVATEYAIADVDPNIPDLIPTLDWKPWVAGSGRGTCEVLFATTA